MPTPKETVTWKVRSGSDRRFNAGHPWLYSNELETSPKGILPGTPIRLIDAQDRFLAWGYGNPHSLISFRAVSRDEGEEDACGFAGVRRRLETAARLRAEVGLSSVSFRWIFGESDFLPGLIIDRYRMSDNWGTEASQVIVIQAQTAGAQKWISELPELILDVVKGNPAIFENTPASQTAILIRNDVGVRKLEGLEEEKPQLVRPVFMSEAMLKKSRIRILSQSGRIGEFIEMNCDLWEGQKTGFFLDQSGNIGRLIQFLQSKVRAKERQTTALGKKERTRIKILDLCTYVGQWSTQVAQAMTVEQADVEVTLVDSSQAALDLAETNVRKWTPHVKKLKADVVHDLGSVPVLPGGSGPFGPYDLVISDPPALIKGRKDMPQGTHAYLQLHTQVMRLAGEGAMVACCSCSALLDEEDFLATLAKAARRNKKSVRWLDRGGHSVDHPVLAEFPEGRYLKAWFGVVHSIGGTRG
ncbi:MAG: class I SAM-dependent rRNA methyltransferase [Bdellovibrionales bacterium]|nr:class I SAM-dependent rRNA methyltransferase [Bdellovibrionales bacterium]